MSEYDNGMARAQRAYDNQMPPKDDSEECQECEGIGKISGQSNCCGAECDDDILLCSECKEHCNLDTCEECDGTGLISKEKLKQLAKECAEDRAYDDWKDKQMEQLDTRRERYE